MKTLDSRDNLLSKIDTFLSTSNPKKLKELEEEVLHDGKITVGDFYRMLSGRYDMNEISNAELYWLTLAISRISKKVGKPEDWFEDAEIGNYKYYDPYEENDQYKNGIVFTNVVKLAENQYMFPLSVGEIKALKNANKLQVVPELQRNYKKDKYGELKTKVNKKTAQEISQLINDGAFFFNGIRFNLMDDGEADPPIFDEDSATLTVRNGTIIVPDGNHRTIGCELSTKNQNDRFGVFFTFLTATQTRRVLNQEWTTVPIPRKHKEAMKTTPSNLIVDAIMRSPDADPIYVNGIVKDGSELRNRNGYILYTELSTAIADYYDANQLKLKADQDELRDWLITYMNYLSKLMYDDFSNYKALKRKKWSVHYFAWRFYIMVSRQIRGLLEWRDILAQIIENTDFEDEEIRSYCSTGNRRKFNDYCNEREVEICTMLK